jgi:hypothetical protein
LGIEEFRYLGIGEFGNFEIMGLRDWGRKKMEDGRETRDERKEAEQDQQSEQSEQICVICG